MTEANAGTRGDNEGDVAALVVARCLHFAAAPTFTTVALLTVVSDSDMPSMLCSAAGSSTLEWNGADVFADGRLSSRAMAQADLPATKRCWHDSFPESRSF